MTTADEPMPTSATTEQGEAGAASGGIVSTAQEAASRARAAATDVAGKVPDAVATAQVAVDDTARALNELPDQTLMLGAAFSLGVGVGLFLTGTNRLTVLLALVPAAAMAATLISRESGRYPQTWEAPAAST